MEQGMVVWLLDDWNDCGYWTWMRNHLLGISKSHQSSERRFLKSGELCLLCHDSGDYITSFLLWLFSYNGSSAGEVCALVPPLHPPQSCLCSECTWKRKILVFRWSLSLLVWSYPGTVGEGSFWPHPLTLLRFTRVSHRSGRIFSLILHFPFPSFTGINETEELLEYKWEQNVACKHIYLLG